MLLKRLPPKKLSQKRPKLKDPSQRLLRPMKRLRRRPALKKRLMKR